MLGVKPVTVNRVKTAAGRFQNSADSSRGSLKMLNGHLGVSSYYIDIGSHYL